MAKSSGEAELYGVVDVAQEAILVQRVFAFFGVNMSMSIGTDSSVARSISQRLGVGGIRHLEVAALWIQEATNRKLIRIDTIPGLTNTADIGTKALGEARLDLLAEMIGVIKYDRKGVIEVKAKKVSGAPEVGYISAAQDMDVGAINSWIRRHPRVAAQILFQVCIEGLGRLRKSRFPVQYGRTRGCLGVCVQQQHA